MTDAIQKAREAAVRLRENLASFDAEVAYQLSIGGERADLWDEIDVNVEDLRSLLADRAAQAERMARLEEALTKRIEWHTCSCPEPCDDYGVFPGGCIGKYREDYRSLRALSQEGSEPS